MGKLIKLNNEKRTIFIGDIHGDIKSVERILKLYPPEENRLVFLGDYVDRGEYSKEVVDKLFNLKEKFFDNIVLLMGNHEAFPIIKCSPSNFWDVVKLKKEEYNFYVKKLINLPLAVEMENILTIHGAVPDINNVEEINDINMSSEDKKFIDTIWGDFEEGIFSPYVDPFSGRPKFGENYFDNIMKKLNKKILIRAHDPKADVIMFNRCITLITSIYYGSRRIAVIEKGVNPESIKDIKIQFL
jgi:predicted MPP superfamily phosphohydrolase